MKLREDRWLRQRLEQWAQQGLLTPQQRDAIQAYEDRQGGRLRLDPIWILAGFAGLCVILGVALIIAHNWERIPAWGRQGAYLAGLTALGVAWQRWQDRPGLARALGVAWLVAPLLGIGLWAQVYHLSGDPFRPFFVAWLLGLGLVWASRDPFLAAVHAAMLAWGLFAGMHEPAGWVGLGRRLFWRSQDAPLPALTLALRLALALGLWAVLLFHLRRLGAPLARLLAWGLFLIYVFTVGESSGFGLGGEAAAMVLAGGLAVLAWAGGLAGVEAESLEGPAAWAGAWVLYIQTFAFKHADGSWWEKVPGPAGLALVNAILALALLAAAFAPLRGLWRRDAEAWWMRLALALPALSALIGSFGEARAWALFLANLFLAAVAAAWMFNGVSRGLPKVVNRGVIFMAALVLTRFVDLFDTLLDSGLAFILAGLGLGALAWLLEKGRRRLLALAQEAQP